MSPCVLVLANLSLMACWVYGEISSFAFTTETWCDLPAKVARGCARLQAGNYKFLGECVLTCRKGCVGVGYEAGRCYTHTECPFNDTCSSAARYKIYLKSPPCLNGGVWSVDQDTCACTGGWVGEICQRRAPSCAELAAYGYSLTEHFVELQTRYDQPTFSTKCDLVSLDVQLTYVMVSQGNANPKCRTWHEFVEGFFFDKFNFWIGLDNIKALNDIGLTTLYLEVVVNGTSRLGYKYLKFSLASAELDYSFVFDSSQKTDPTATYGDCMSAVKGSRFSNWDHDRDDSKGKNCASDGGGGWWYSTCSPVGCVPLGSWKDRKMDGINMKDGSRYDIIMYFTN